MSDELYISYFFFPDEYVSGINVLKRIIENERKVDVLHKKHNNTSDFLNEYVDNHLSVDIGCDNDRTLCIFEFIKKGMKAIKNDYKKIYSRSWLMANHFLAAEYKFKYPNTFWTAEFSDPLIFDLSNNVKRYKEMIIDNEDYINKINSKITEYNKLNATAFDLIKNKSSAYFVCEYLIYLFADKIIFTNENQREVMLNQFPINIKDDVINKTEIKNHSTLPNKFYYLKKTDLDLDKDLINIAYFGNDYYGKRHFESLFYAVDSLNHKYKDKLRFHLYISDVKLVKQLIKPLNSADLFIVKKPLEYFEFLNATTQYDVLIVNDAISEESYEKNPYLPSKISDYLQSGSDIWALYEKNSTLSRFNLKYMSEIKDFSQSLLQIVKILHDNGFVDENYEFIDNYLFKRLTVLNELYEKEFRRNEMVKPSKWDKLFNKIKNR